MNKITKTYPAPAILTDKGLGLTNALTKQVESDQTDLSFDYKTYGHKTVKEQLVKDQHNKCAYCEQTLNGDFGDVEHYRPKAGYCIQGQTKLTKPGYYWLAYSWDNMLLSCSTCNRRHKKNLFPLLDEATRDIAHRDITKEAPLFLNPVADNPGEHVLFERHIIKPQITDGTEDPVGKTTIETFKLNEREDLVERRSVRWKEYQTLLMAVKIIEAMPDSIALSGIDIPACLQKAKEQLCTMTSEQSEFTGMFKYQIEE